MELRTLTEKISEYQFNDIIINQKEKFEVQITENMINEFAKISGDYNPIHVDEEYAKQTKFGKRICHGMLLSSLFSRLVGMYLTGKNSLYFFQSLNFISPCFINDKVIVEGEIVDKSDSTKIITLKTTIINSNGDELVKGLAKVIVR